MTNMTFDLKKLSQFKRKYKLALKHKRQSFIFNGHEFLVDYAKYIIEYLTLRLTSKTRGIITDDQPN